MKPKLVIYGAGANGRMLAWEYRDLNKYKLRDRFELVGFIDDFKKGSLVDFPILGDRKDLPQLKAEGIDNIVISLVTCPEKRLEVCLELESIGFNFPNINPYLPKEMDIGKGVFIHDNTTFIGSDQKIGNFSIIGPYVTVEGGVEIGRGVILSPYVFIGHGSKIGDASVFYVKSSCLLNVDVGKNCKIYPHVIVHKDLKDKKIKKR